MFKETACLTLSLSSGAGAAMLAECVNRATGQRAGGKLKICNYLLFTNARLGEKCVCGGVGFKFFKKINYPLGACFWVYSGLRQPFCSHFPQGGERGGEA